MPVMFGAKKKFSPRPAKTAFVPSAPKPAPKKVKGPVQPIPEMEDDLHQLEFTDDEASGGEPDGADVDATSDDEEGGAGRAAATGPSLLSGLVPQQRAAGDASRAPVLPAPGMLGRLGASAPGQASSSSAGRGGTMGPPSGRTGGSLGRKSAFSPRPANSLNCAAPTRSGTSSGSSGSSSSSRSAGSVDVAALGTSALNGVDVGSEALLQALGCFNFKTVRCKGAYRERERVGAGTGPSPGAGATAAGQADGKCDGSTQDKDSQSKKKAKKADKAPSLTKTLDADRAKLVEHKLLSGGAKVPSAAHKPRRTLPECFGADKDYDVHRVFIRKDPNGVGIRFKVPLVLLQSRRDKLTTPLSVRYHA